MNPKYKFGSQILSVAELKEAGPATRDLHKYYMDRCKAKDREPILGVLRPGWWLMKDEVEMDKLSVAISDLYDLFKLDALDMSLLRYFILTLVVEAKRHRAPVGFLDPESMSSTMLKRSRSFCVDYMIRAYQLYAKKKMIMFVHNSGGHWVAVVILLRHNSFLYFDSLRSSPIFDVSPLTNVIDEAWNSYCNNKKFPMTNLEHVSKFACHQQPGGLVCGFYAAYHMIKAMELVKGNPEEFEVPISPLDKDTLVYIRERIVGFIMDQVIKPTGQFHIDDKTMAEMLNRELNK